MEEIYETFHHSRPCAFRRARRRKAEIVKIGLFWDARESALNQAYEDFMKAEAKAQGAAAGVTVEWVVNMANNDSSRQAANIEDLINAGVNIVIARALDAAAIGSSIRRAKKANVPFVTFDPPSSGVKPTAHVGGDSAHQAKHWAKSSSKFSPPTRSMRNASSCRARSPISTQRYHQDRGADPNGVESQDRAVRPYRCDARASGSELHPRRV
jgi:hypothetical protein